MNLSPRLLGGLVLVAAGVLALGGCRKAPGPNDAEQAALKALEVYEPVPEADEKGRVVKLKLEGRHVDDEALDQVQHFVFLRSLSLMDASVTDAGLLKLRDLKRLTELGITGTHVTDRGLASLQKMPSLRHVWVTENDRLTQGGVAALKKALPGINVNVMNRPEKKPEPPAKKAEQSARAAAPTK